MNARGCSAPMAQRISVCATVCAAVILLSATTHAIGDDNQLDDMLLRLDERSKTIEDLTADFVEKKFTVLLKEPLVSKGYVKVIGSRTRWDTTEPYATTLFTDDKQVTFHFPSRNTAEVYPIDRRLRPLIVSPVPRLTTLKRHFFIEQITDAPSAENLHLRLTPKDDTLTEFIGEVHLLVALSDGIARRFEMIDPDGDRTVIEFANIRINVGLSGKDVACSFPPDTRIVHPLDPGDRQQPSAAGSNQP